MEQTNNTQDFTFEIVHQESNSRGQLLLRSFFGVFYIMIPHGIALAVMGLVGAILSFVSWWAVLFTGKYPRSLFDFQVGLLQWNARVNARMLNLVDGYPAFGTSAQDNNVKVNVVYPESLSRGVLLLRAFLGMFYVMIPHGICLMFRGIATYFVVFIAWWAVLITGKYPKGMFDFVVGTIRWATRINIYMGFLTDKYPPFSGK
jgi:hypothetical protein